MNATTTAKPTVADHMKMLKKLHDAEHQLNCAVLGTAEEWAAAKEHFEDVMAESRAMRQG